MSFGSRSLKAPTVAERARMRSIAWGCCVVCQKRGNFTSGGVEVQHLLSGGMRMGHRYTIGLCSYHHRGVRPLQFTRAQMRDVLGYSLMDGSKLFHAEHGSDIELLAYQDEVLEWRDAA